MNRKLLLTSLMISVMGFSSLFAQEEEAVHVKSEQHLSCDCDHTEEEVKTSLVVEEEEEVKAVEALSCEKCKVQDNEEEKVLQVLSCDKCKKNNEEETKDSSVS